jgi:Tfp pilus assembly protein PilN
MSDTDVVFEDDPSNVVGNIRIVPGVPTGMLSWLVKEQVVKNAKQAEQLLMFVAIGAAILGVLVFWLGATSKTITATPAQLEELKHMVHNNSLVQ